MTRPIHKVAAIVVKNGQVLVVHKRGSPSRYFISPGGKPLIGEGPEEALRRELAEELGVDLESYSFIGRFEDTSAFEDVPILVDAYQVEISGTPRPGSEIDDLKWIDTRGTPQDIFLGSVLSDHIIPILDRGR
jgi:8-oxo-dGTP diphosphatase